MTKVASAIKLGTLIDISALQATVFATASHFKASPISVAKAGDKESEVLNETSP